MVSNSIQIISILKMKGVINRLSYDIRLLQTPLLSCIDWDNIVPIGGPYAATYARRDSNGAKLSATHMH